MITLLTKCFELSGSKTAKYYYWHDNEVMIGLPQTQLN